MWLRKRGPHQATLGCDANLDATTVTLPKGDLRTSNLGAVREVLFTNITVAPTAYQNTVNRWAERDNLGRLTRVIEYNGVTQASR